MGGLPPTTPKITRTSVAKGSHYSRLLQTCRNRPLDCRTEPETSQSNFPSRGGAARHWLPAVEQASCWQLGLSCISSSTSSTLTLLTLPSALASMLLLPPMNQGKGGGGRGGSDSARATNNSPSPQSPVPTNPGERLSPMAKFDGLAGAPARATDPGTMGQCVLDHVDRPFSTATRPIAPYRKKPRPVPWH